jgi:hypothetical protein
MRLSIDNCRLLFDIVPGTAVRSSHDLHGVTASIETSAESLIVDQVSEDSAYRWLAKYDRFGQQSMRMLLDIRYYGAASVQISEDNTGYAIDEVSRACVSPVWEVFGMRYGEVVVLDPRLAPDPTRNIYRYNADGSLRWQIGSHDFRPDDVFWNAESLKNGNIRARASLNGWSAEVDDATGEILRILATNEK